MKVKMIIVLFVFSTLFKSCEYGNLVSVPYDQNNNDTVVSDTISTNDNSSDNTIQTSNSSVGDIVNPNTEPNKEFTPEKAFSITDTICNVTNPRENLEWLALLIKKATFDKTGNYMGTIWLEKYKSNNIFITNMALNSGGVAYYFFDCNGSSFIPEDTINYINSLKWESVVYSNIPIN